MGNTHLELLGFVDAKQGPVAGVEVLGDDSVLDRLLDQGVRHAVVCIGDSSRRTDLGGELLERGFELPSVVHAKADIGVAVLMGKGNIIFPGATILPRAEIGDFCVIEAGCFVGHDTRLGDGVFLGARSIVGNHAEVAPMVKVGMAAKVPSGSKVVASTKVPDFQLWR